MRERWFLLLLFALLVHLGGCGSREDGQPLNTTWPDSATENDFYGMDNGNGSELASGMEKNRRFRRSADSDLDKSTKDLEKKQGEFNDTKREYEKKEKEYDDAVKAQDRIKDEKEKADEYLKTLNNDVTEASRFANERKSVYDIAKIYDERLAKQRLNLLEKLSNESATLKTKNETFEKSMGVWRIEETKMNNLETKYNEEETKNDTAFKALTNAESDHKEIEDLLKDYEDGIRDQISFNKPNGNIKTYEKYNRTNDVKIENTNIMNDEKLKKKFDDAAAILIDKKKIQSEIENNKILKKEITGNFGTKTASEVYMEMDGKVIDIESQINAEKDPSKLPDLMKQHEEAKEILKFIEHLKQLDNSKMVKDFVDDFITMKNKAEQRVADAQRVNDNAEANYKRVKKLIEDATNDLFGIDLDDLKNKHDRDTVKLTILNGKIAETEKKLDAIAKTHGEPNGKTSWEKIKEKRKSAITSKQSEFESAKAMASRAHGEYTKKRNAVNETRELIRGNEEKEKEDQEEKTEKIDEELGKNAQKLNSEDRKKKLNEAEKEMNRTKTHKEELEAKIRLAEEALKIKENEHYKSLQKKDNAIKAMNAAKANFEDAEKNVAKAKEDVVQAQAQKVKADKDAEEHKTTIANLTIGMSTAIGILLLVAIGIAIAFVLIKRKKKKAASEQQPEKQEFDDPCGLTRVVRPGQPDQFVIKGKDIQLRGPLFRPKVHNRPLPMKHKLEGQEGGDKIDKIFFAKELNEGFFIGEGVEICEPDSVSVSEGKGNEDTAGSAKFEWDDGLTYSTRYKKEEAEKAAGAKNEKKTASSKSKRTKKSPVPKPAPDAAAPSSSSADEKNPLVKK